MVNPVTFASPPTLTPLGNASEETIKDFQAINTALTFCAKNLNDGKFHPSWSFKFLGKASTPVSKYVDRLQTKYTAKGASHFFTYIEIISETKKSWEKSYADKKKIF